MSRLASPLFRIAIRLSVLSAVVFRANAVQAWGNEGHELVCRIAYQLLDEAERAELNRLVESYRVPDGNQQGWETFAQYCKFADHARNKARDYEEAVDRGDETQQKELRVWEPFIPYEYWHYLNLGRSAKVAKSCNNEDCVVAAIDIDFTIFADTSEDDETRAESLFFLAHWVGDVHQPLHVSFRSDSGGVAINTNLGPHLHSIWDSTIPAAAKDAEGVSWGDYATSLRHRIQSMPQAAQDEWLESERVDWANESYQITTQPDVLYCAWKNNYCQRIPYVGKLKLPKGYVKKFVPDVEKRFMQAGLRLSKLLKRGLNP